MEPEIKQNVNRFNEDVRRGGTYIYNTDKLSCRLARTRIIEGMTEVMSFKGLRILDLGCGDGMNSVNLITMGAASVLGIDPASEAITAATQRAQDRGLADKVKFQTGSIYDLDLQERFDCVVFNGVLHHLSDPARAIACGVKWSDRLLILEPNGTNPIVKLIEKLSSYHRKHEERSFLVGSLEKWCRDAGLTKLCKKYINLVPMFCPDWIAVGSRTIEPVVEQIPLLRNICCGQIVIRAEKG